MSESIKELKEKILSSIEDSSKVEVLLNELILEVKRKSLQVLALNCGKIEESQSGNNYEIIKTDRGILYHEFGGYSIFVRPNITSLYEGLMYIFDYLKSEDSLKEEEKEAASAAISAMVQCLSVPKIAFTDVDYMVKVAINNLEFIRKSYDELMNKPLSEETTGEDYEFENASKALEDIMNNIQEG